MQITNLASSTTSPSVETEQPSFRRFHVPCRYPSRVEPLAAAAEAAEQQPDGKDDAYVKHILGLMPSSGNFTNILDANALDGKFGKAIR